MLIFGGKIERKSKRQYIKKVPSEEKISKRQASGEIPLVLQFWIEWTNSYDDITNLPGLFSLGDNNVPSYTLWKPARCKELALRNSSGVSLNTVSAVPQLLSHPSVFWATVPAFDHYHSIRNLFFPVSNWNFLYSLTSAEQSGKISSLDTNAAQWLVGLSHKETKMTCPKLVH